MKKMLYNQVLEYNNLCLREYYQYLINKNKIFNKNPYENSFFSSQILKKSSFSSISEKNQTSPLQNEETLVKSQQPDSSSSFTDKEETSILIINSQDSHKESTISQESVDHKPCSVEKMPQDSKANCFQFLQQKFKKIKISNSENYPIKQEPTKLIKQETDLDQKIKHLANKNMKSNLAKSILNFISFLRNVEINKKNQGKAEEYQELRDFLCFSYKFRSIEEWKNIFNNENYGKKFRKICLLFFGKSFAQTYLQNSKITKEYKPLYFRKIKDFYLQAKNPAKYFKKAKKLPKSADSEDQQRPINETKKRIKIDDIQCVQISNECLNNNYQNINNTEIIENYQTT